jgi:hypothetical protein
MEGDSDMEYGSKESIDKLRYNSSTHNSEKIEIDI